MNFTTIFFCFHAWDIFVYRWYIFFVLYGHLELWSFSPFYRYLVYVFFIKTLIIMSISNNNNRPYVCDPLGPYISLVNNAIGPITPYWSTLLIIHVDIYIN